MSSFFSGNITQSDTLAGIAAQIFGNGWADFGREAIFGEGSESASMTPCVSIDVASTEIFFGALRRQTWDILSS